MIGILIIGGIIIVIGYYCVKVVTKEALESDTAKIKKKVRKREAELELIKHPIFLPSIRDIEPSEETNESEGIPSSPVMDDEDEGRE